MITYILLTTKCMFEKQYIHFKILRVETYNNLLLIILRIIRMFITIFFFLNFLWHNIIKNIEFNYYF